MTIGWGIIGVGAVTQVKAGPPVFRQAGSDLVHVMRRTPDAARQYATDHEVPRWSTKADDVIADPAVDVVYVATPTAAHHEHTMAAIAAGKHVLVEKPMAMTAAQAREMVAAADTAGVRLWVAYYRRTLPRFRLLADLLADGVAGEVLSVATTWRKPRTSQGWRWDPEQNRGGEFFEAACHTVDAVDFLLGPVRDGSGTHDPGFRTVAAAYRAGTVPATATVTFGCADYVEETVIAGTAATLRFSSFAPVPLQVHDATGTVREYPLADPAHVHGPLVESILAELRGEGSCPSTSVSALRTAEVMEQMLDHDTDR